MKSDKKETFIGMQENFNIFLHYNFTPPPLPFS